MKSKTQRTNRDRLGVLAAEADLELGGLDVFTRDQDLFSRVLFCCGFVGC
jgi:hypothetical protein